GAIFGTFFRNGGKALNGKDALDAAGLAAFLRAGVDGVRQRGGAAVGDKTCVDAMEPAAVKGEEVSSQSLPEAIQAVAAATEAGKEASKAMVAKFGRAKTLGEACIGFPDAGACSVLVIIEAFRDYIAE
ncbi:MAG: DAK2 domain-containing protein, partial [Prosthecobacter sp.]